ncbi:probable transporter [gamma proteobacterium HTCC2207]|uniref:Probable transporter n=1 Tax=gamma proteobacterium HTCC2207 TaxID=314287 RepID=Q1YQW6_9GAMM|nr:probable transporter [gamma proteobacterium HTCC2207]MBT6114315.1 SLC13/DASS family transporter [Porticoccaceae bacterium]MBT6593742.1 SLC13/DASS family transporter [Porticoccaceae bacterium]MDG1079360.1 SLC13 family permease [Porticoccaceae bacterium]MDG1081564.1 SLC13 family permease [Porticoccaceae bacterium]
MTPKLRRLSLWLAPLIAVAVTLLMMRVGWAREGALTGGLTVLCALWWIFEPIPIPATAMIPLGVFPLLGILDGKQVAQAYGDPLIILLMGGAMLSKAMEKSGAHRRLALYMVNLFGGDSQRRLVMGFMVASAALSMWVSNTATTLMLLPVAYAVLQSVDSSGGTSQDSKKLAVPLFLGIAYAASIGGLGTPIGSPPNIVFLKIYGEATGSVPSFTQWMLWGLPVVMVLLPLAALWITRHLDATAPLRIPQAGAWRSEEARVLVIFFLTALAWITLREPFGGWSQWLNVPSANYAAVALTSVILMFILPNGQGGKLLDWESASTIHWGVLLLFAGGIAIAKAFAVTGISGAIGESLSGVTRLSIIVLIAVVALTVTFLTEITSNTATTTLLMPILAAASLGAGFEPALLMLPAALSASCAFMLPVATAPNAIVFGTGKITVEQMVREGFALNLIGVAVITAVVYFWLG